MKIKYKHVKVLNIEFRSFFIKYIILILMLIVIYIYYFWFFKLIIQFYQYIANLKTIMF